MRLSSESVTSHMYDHSSTLLFQIIAFALLSKNTLAVVTLRTFALGNIVLPREIKLNFIARKHIFGAQIENSMLENYADQRKVVLLFSLLFFTLLQRARRSRVIFLQRLITRRAQRRRQAALLRVFTAFALQGGRTRRIAWVLQASVLV